MYSSLHYKNFIAGTIITTIVSVIIICLSFYIGKEYLFLFFNHNFGIIADWFFFIYTNAGDGFIWLVLLLVSILYKKKITPLIVTAFVVSTVLVQGCKHFIAPNVLRPIKAIANTAVIHVVQTPHETGSFPSGHTATAFCVFLIACLLIKNKRVVVVGFVAALLVGYSRVYLAQHFPLDVAVGMLVAIASVTLAILVQKKWNVQILKKSV